MPAASKPIAQTWPLPIRSSGSSRRLPGRGCFCSVGCLQTLFLWRLRIVRPEVVELGIDTMVMDNDDALCRDGVKPTYKKKKGFQPLQMNWGRFIVDAVFRGGDKHSNHGDTVLNMIRHMVIKIKRDYRWDVPIIIRMDSGFFDQKIFNLCEALHVGYVCGGKMYENIKQVAANWDENRWQRFESTKKESWQYAEFGCRQGNWKRFRRAIYCRLMHDDRNQLYLPGCRPDTVIVTNIGQGQAIDWLLKDAGATDYLTANGLIACYHERGSDELANRALKDFGHEQLPFKRFAPNACLVLHDAGRSFPARIVQGRCRCAGGRHRFLCLHGAQTVDRYCRQDRFPQRRNDPEGIPILFGKAAVTRVVPAVPGRAGYRIIGTEISQSKRKPMYRCVRKPLYFVYKPIKTDF